MRNIPRNLRLTTLHTCAALGLMLLTMCALVQTNARAQSGRGERVRVVGGGGPGGDSRAATQEGRSVLSGRVLYEETGEPVRRARVTLDRRDASDFVINSFTNDRGEFRFENLAAGEYDITTVSADAPQVNASTFRVPLPTGDPQRDDAAFAEARRAANPNAVAVTVDGTNNVAVEVRLPREPRGGVVSGLVTYDDGKPAANARITFLNRKELRGRMPGPTMLSVTTDKNGSYRASGLPPGEYVVSARLQEPIIVNKQGEKVGGGLVINTYYPSATSARGATPVQVGENAEQSGINITLVKRAAHIVSGTLITRNGRRPLANTHVRLRNREDLELPMMIGPGDRFIWTDAQGHFSFNNVMDGSYILTVGGPNSPPPPPPVPPRGATATTGSVTMSAGGVPPTLRSPDQIFQRPSRQQPAQMFAEKQQEITVAGTDVSNMLIEISEGARISGTIEMEGGGPVPPRILITSEMKPGERRPALMARVNPDGTFVMSGVPEGPLSVDVLISPPGRFYVKSIMAGGVEMTRQPLLVTDSADVRGVRILLSSNVSVLMGHVLSSDGAAVGGATIMLLPAGQDAERARISRLIGVSNPAGEFALGCPPGEYRVVVWRYNGPPPDPESLRALAASAQSITILEGERKVVDLTAPDDK